MPNLRCRLLISARTSTRSRASRLDSGSSSSSTSGSMTSVRASATRCRCPPVELCGAPVGERTEAYESEHGVDFRTDFRMRELAPLQAERGVRATLMCGHSA